MSLSGSFMNMIGFKKGFSESGACGGEVEIKDGQVIGNPYSEFGGGGDLLTPEAMVAAYNKVSCVGTSIDLISNNIQMIEPVFWDDETRTALEYPADNKLKAVRRLFEKPNSTDNRKSFLTKSVKNYVLNGCVYYVMNMATDRQITAIKIIDNNLVSPMLDISNARIGNYLINNAGAYSGNYIFNGSYYEMESNKDFVLAPFINGTPNYQYLPASILAGTGVEVLMYWFGCFHNKSLLQNGARPSLMILIKSMLNPKHREQLREEIRVRHSGAGNAGSAIIIDGSADKDIKQLSQNNKDMEFKSILEAAEDAVYKRLGTNWVLGKNINSKDLQKGMEMLFDMTVCPMFQGFLNHVFDVYKYFNPKYNYLRLFYLEQDIPALRPRFLAMMKDMPNLGIFTISERRKMYNYPPLGDERDNELTVQTVKVTQTSGSGDNTTGFAAN